MKITEKKTRPAHEYDEVVGLECDICKDRFDYDWGASQYDILETKIVMEVGERFPEGGFSEKTAFDVCPKCFKERVIPALEEMGARPTVKKIDF